jgi:hypothetical protein
MLRSKSIDSQAGRVDWRVYPIACKRATPGFRSRAQRVRLDQCSATNAVYFFFRP